MTYLIRLLVSTILFLSGSLWANELNVGIPQLSLDLKYKNSVRLHQVLHDTGQQLAKADAIAPFWLAAQLIEPQSNEEIDQLKAKVTERLYFLASSYPEYQVKVNVLLNALNNNPFNYRHFTVLDYDLIRISPEHNPLLTGDYQLLLPARTDRIQVVGSFDNEYVHLIQNGSIDEYLEATKMPEFSELHSLYIIQPDGTLIQTDNAYWTQDRTYLAPGSILFSGIKDLPSGFALLNEQFAELLRYKSPVSMENINQ